MSPGARLGNKRPTLSNLVCIMHGNDKQSEIPLLISWPAALLTELCKSPRSFARSLSLLLLYCNFLLILSEGPQCFLLSIEFIGRSGRRALARRQVYSKLRASPPANYSPLAHTDCISLHTYIYLFSIFLGEIYVVDVGAGRQAHTHIHQP
jgi:hypothetical protein